MAGKKIGEKVGALSSGRLAGAPTLTIE